MKRLKLTRRRFLQIGGVAGAAALPALFGYDVWRLTEGEGLPARSPYAPPERVASPTSAPLLIITPENSANPFGTYLSEILRAEGLNCFQSASITDLNADRLELFDTAILAEGSITLVTWGLSSATYGLPDSATCATVSHRPDQDRRRDEPWAVAIRTNSC